MVYGPPTAKEIWAALFANFRERKLQQLTGGSPVATATAPKPVLEESKYKDVAFIREGQKVIIPPEMTWDEIAFWAARRKSEDERVVSVHEELPYSPMDGAVAFYRALADIYGWVDLVPTGWWQDPPAMIGVMIGPDERMQVPWGSMKVQGIEGVLGTGMQEKPVPRFLIHGEVKYKSLPQVQAIVARTLKFLKEKSIYKGKAVKISYEWQRQGIRFDASIHCPQFMRLNGVSEDDLIFGEEVQTALEIGLFTPIAYADAMRKFKVPLKRGVLLHGPFGTGKTLTANITAIKAVKAGFTFIYLDNVLDLKKGLEFAAQYGPVSFLLRTSTGPSMVNAQPAWTKSSTVSTVWTARGTSASRF
jgi:transitional endoplasmic reticulum ATPase